MPNDSSRAADENGGAPIRHPLTDLLIEDLKHFGESLWRNDDIGEKRFNFFLTLVTAVIAGLVTLHTSASLDVVGVKTLITCGVLWGMLALGVLTYIRLLLRNRVNQEYHSTLDYIRRRLIALYPDASFEDYQVPRKPRAHWEERIWKKLKGGLAGMTAALDGALLFLALFMSSTPAGVAAVSGVGLFVIFWIIAANRERGTVFTDQYFRAGAGAVILDRRGHVLVLKRRGADDGFWQLPQGGLEDGEEPERAARREIFEETGIVESKLKRLRKCDELLAYELPAGDRSAKTGRGQVHYWFLFRFLGTAEEIELPKCGEFEDKDWIPIDELEPRAVGFRRPVYRRLADHARRLQP
jgi:putative (di)nucleoside polyphosphate hydrolase